jgi:hypothetical protein
MIANYGIINDRSPHIVADLCEIIAYFEETEVSRGDIKIFIAEKCGEVLFRELELERDESAEINARIQTFTEDAFLHLRYRMRVFGDWYPFNVQDNVISPVDTTNRRRIYAALLGYSRLKMFTRAERQNFAGLFESLCYHAASGLFPGWRIIHFGTSGADRPDFGNKLKIALEKLSEKLRDPTVKQYVDEISEHDSGDAGIDIVVIKEWSDSAQAVPVYFGQCAAQQENWPEKVFEAHHVNLEKYFSFFHKPGALIFIPVCYRNPDGKWVNLDGHQFILIDKLRITEMLEQVIYDEIEDESEIGISIETPFELGCALENI